jgi:hypothetical protein
MDCKDLLSTIAVATSGISDPIGYQILETHKEPKERLADPSKVLVLIANLACHAKLSRSRS